MSGVRRAILLIWLLPAAAWADRPGFEPAQVSAAEPAPPFTTPGEEPVPGHPRLIVYAGTGIGAGERRLEWPTLDRCQTEPADPRVAQRAFRYGVAAGSRLELAQTVQGQARIGLTHVVFGDDAPGYCTTPEAEGRAHLDVVRVDVEATARWRPLAGDRLFYFGAGPRVGLLIGTGWAGVAAPGARAPLSPRYDLSVLDGALGVVLEAGVLAQRGERLDVGLRFAAGRAGEGLAVELQLALGYALY